MKYWIAIPIKLDVVQYSARPLGNVNEKNAIITGINQSIIAWLPACLGSVEGCMVIFCCTQVDTNTRAGMRTLIGLSPIDGDSAKSNHKNPGFSGAAENTGVKGIQVYIFSDNPTRLSGLENTT